MTSVDVSVDIKPAQQAMLALGGVFQQQPYLALVGQRLLAWVNQNFVQHGAEIPWAPLSPNTIASRRGGGVSVTCRISARRARRTVWGRPGRGRSGSPSSPRRTYRRRQAITVGRLAIAAVIFAAFAVVGTVPLWYRRGADCPPGYSQSTPGYFLARAGLSFG